MKTKVLLKHLLFTTSLFFFGLVFVNAQSNNLSPCDDGNPATLDIIDECGNCFHLKGVVRIGCDDNDPKTIDFIDPQTGACKSVACDDGDPNTVDIIDITGTCRHILSCEFPDCDNDGIPDKDEADCNNNNLPDDCENLEDCNQDGTPDVCQNLEDCNQDGTPDVCQNLEDCNQDGTPDVCQNLEDCNQDGTPDVCQNLEDCNQDGTPDVCQNLEDCNQDGTPDVCHNLEDCNQDGTPDVCQNLADCNQDGTPDVCQNLEDCDNDGIPDVCEPDCDNDGTPDDCETDSDNDGTPDDCDPCPGDANDNCACPGLVSDGCKAEVAATFDGCFEVLVCSSKDLSNIVIDYAPAGVSGSDVKKDGLSGYSKTITGSSIIYGVWIKSGCNQSGDCPGCGEYVANPNADDCSDCDGDGTLDEDEEDCNNNGTPDDCEQLEDCNQDGTPDVCQNLEDCNQDGTPDVCQNLEDCNQDGTPDVCQNLEDCNQDGTPDVCQNLEDCNQDGTPDVCQNLEDCNQDGIPDVCQNLEDCNQDGTPDVCQNLEDCDNDGIPDDCEADSDNDGTPDDCDPCPNDANDECNSVDCTEGLTSKGCKPEVAATFDGCFGVTTCSAKDLSNVVLDFKPAGFGKEDKKYDGLNGKTRDFSADEFIIGVWIKSGCNQSGDCPGCGEYIANPNDCSIVDSAPNTESELEVLKANQREMVVYPNPTNDKVYLNLDVYKGLSAQIAVFNHQGQQLITKNIKSLTELPVQLDMNRYESGNYLIKIQIPDAQKSIVKSIILFKE